MKRVMKFFSLDKTNGHIENEECAQPMECIPTGQYVLSITELRELHASDSFEVWAKNRGVEIKW